MFSRKPDFFYLKKKVCEQYKKKYFFFLLSINKKYGINNPTEAGFTKIACGAFHSVALRQNGTIRCWGDNRYNQLNNPTEAGFTKIACGDYHTVALKTGSRTFHNIVVNLIVTTYSECRTSYCSVEVRLDVFFFHVNKKCCRFSSCSFSHQPSYRWSRSSAYQCFYSGYG